MNPRTRSPEAPGRSEGAPGVLGGVGRPPRPGCPAHSRLPPASPGSGPRPRLPPFHVFLSPQHWSHRSRKLPFMQSSEAAWTGPPPSLPSFLTAKSRGAPGCPATQHHLLWPGDHVADLPGSAWLCAPTRSPVCVRRLVLVLVHSSADDTSAASVSRPLASSAAVTTGRVCLWEFCVLWIKTQKWWHRVMQQVQFQADGCTNLKSHQWCMRVSFSSHPCWDFCWFFYNFFYYGHSDRCEALSHGGADLHLPDS